MEVYSYWLCHQLEELDGDTKEGESKIINDVKAIMHEEFRNIEKNVVKLIRDKKVMLQNHFTKTFDELYHSLSDIKVSFEEAAASSFEKKELDLQSYLKEYRACRERLEESIKNDYFAKEKLIAFRGSLIESLRSLSSTLTQLFKNVFMDYKVKSNYLLNPKLKPLILCDEIPLKLPEVSRMITRPLPIHKKCKSNSDFSEVLQHEMAELRQKYEQVLKEKLSIQAKLDEALEDKIFEHNKLTAEKAEGLISENECNELRQEYKKLKHETRKFKSSGSSSPGRDQLDLLELELQAAGYRCMLERNLEQQLSQGAEQIDHSHFNKALAWYQEKRRLLPPKISCSYAEEAWATDPRTMPIV
jgi:hypothetical protein